MSTDDIILTAQKRDVLGKQVKQIRSEGQTPAVIHARGEESINVSVETAAFKKAFLSAGKHHAIKLDVDGKKYTTIIKEVVHAPASSSFYHAVFQAIKEDEKVTAELPLKLIGEIPAERANLLVLKNIEHIAIEALPKDLIDVIEVDASKLIDPGDKILVSDIKLPSTITLKGDPEAVVASVETPKDQIAEADAALEEQAEQEGAAQTEGEATEGDDGSSEQPAAKSEESTDETKES